MTISTAMKQVFFYCTVFILLCSCDQNKPAQHVSAGNADGWISLLEDNLSAWSESESLKAEVVDGVLSLTASGRQPTAMLITHESFDNFHLKLDIQSSDIQSSLFFRLNDQSLSASERPGYTISIDANPDQLNPIGTIHNVARSTIPDNFDAKQWNTLEVTAIGTHLSVFINDQLVAEANDKQFQSGKIGLQVPSNAGKTIRFRNIKIQKLVTIAMVTELVEDRYRSDTERDWEPLFDGKSLTGWSAIGDGTWEVEEGVLHGYSGVEGGFLVNEKSYKNFYLLAKFKIIKEDNSGIWVRKSPDSANVSITDAIECNIYDHNGPIHAYSTGSIATHARAWYGMIDYDDWNEMEIFAEEEHIVMFVNGEKSSESYLPSKFSKAGNVCLQGGIKVFAEDKGPSDVYFKEIMIKSMD